MKTKMKISKIIAESSILLAFAIILNLIKLVSLPYGGAITLASILPIVIISLRHGFKWGFIAGLVYGTTDLLLGLSVLSYVTGWQSVVAVIVLDYVLAFGFIGFASLAKKINNQTIAMLIGVLIASALRYICHVISGCTVWAGLSIPTSHALIYSLGYNATYMIPETIVTLLVGFYVSSIIDYKSEKLKFSRTHPIDKKYLVPFYIDVALVIGVLIFDSINIFKVLQDQETGDFVFSNIVNANWILIGIITFIGVIIGLVFTLTYVLILKHRGENNDSTYNNAVS